MVPIPQKAISTLTKETPTALLTRGVAHCGTVFELTPSGNSWIETILYAFTGGQDGCFPHAVTLRGGDLYGTAITGGAHGLGTVFQLTPAGPPWLKNTLYSSLAEATAKNPVAAALSLITQGTCMGPTIHKGAGGGGTAFELEAGSFMLTRLYGFSADNCNHPDGPQATLVMDQAGNLYGTTVVDGDNCMGAVFKLTPSGDGTWTYQSLHDFTGGNDGAFPYSNIVFDDNGNLYGTAFAGGANGHGVVFEITP